MHARQAVTAKRARYGQLLSVDPGTWRDGAALIGEYFTTFGRQLPGQPWEEHKALLERLNAAR